MTRPVLYSFRRCPYAMRARLAIAASGITVELREITFRNKPAEMLAISPKGTVPVLVFDDGLVLEESLDIIRWTLKNSDAGDQLMPETATMSDAIDLVIKLDQEFKPHLDHYKYPNRYEEIDPLKARTSASNLLLKLNEMLTGHSYLFGQTRSVADIGIAPFVRQFAHVDQNWFYDQNWQNLIRWLDAFKNSEHFQQIMLKYPIWSPDSDPIIFHKSSIRTYYHASKSNL